MNKKIFIIDNEANILYSLKALFSETGFEVGVENSFCEIKKMVENIISAQSGMLIVDINFFNDCSWADFLHAVKGDEDLKNICVVVYTLNQDDKIEKRVLNNGADYFFSKNDLVVGEFFKKILKIYNNIIKK